MKATVRLVNPLRGMYAAEIISSSEYVIFELLDSAEQEIGDAVSYSDFYSMGHKTFNNLTQHCQIDVSIEDICGANLVRKKCML